LHSCSVSSPDYLMINAAYKNTLLVELEHIDSLLDNTTRQTSDLAPYPDLPLQIVNTGLLDVKVEVRVSDRSRRESRQVLLKGVDRIIVAMFDLYLWGDVL